MAKVPKIQCSTILGMVFFSNNKVLVTTMVVVKNDNRNLLLITSAYRSLHFSYAINVWKNRNLLFMFL